MSSENYLDLIDSAILPAGWVLKPLAEVAKINVNSTTLREFSWINYTDISSAGSRVVDPPKKLDRESAPSRARRLLTSGDTVISTVRPNRKTFFYFEGQWERAVASTGFAVISPISQVDSLFLYFVLTSDYAIEFYESICEGGAYPAFNPSRLTTVRVPWAPTSQRRAVGNFLRRIDDKIAVNFSTSTTLESIAQTLFRSWFVDFDPVRAKMAGEKPVGMDDATAALFPDSMEESELGDIPAGWEVTSVGEFCPLKYGKSLPAPQRQPGSVSVYGSNGIVGFHSVSLLEAPAVVIGRKGTVGSVTLSLDPCWVIDTAFYCSPERVENLPLAYLSLQRLGLENMNSDAAVPGLNRENAHRLLFIIANEPIRARFAEIVGSTFAKIHSIQAEVDSLVSIRETLLPRLISGQLQVPEDLVA